MLNILRSTETWALFLFPAALSGNDYLTHLASREGRLVSLRLTSAGNLTEEWVLMDLRPVINYRLTTV